MAEIPAPVRKLLIPLLFRLGKALGKHERFEGAPEPIERAPSRRRLVFGPWTWSSPEGTGRSLFTWSASSSSAMTAPAG